MKTFLWFCYEESQVQIRTVDFSKNLYKREAVLSFPLLQFFLPLASEVAARSPGGCTVPPDRYSASRGSCHPCI